MRHNLQGQDYARYSTVEVEERLAAERAPIEAASIDDWTSAFAKVAITLGFVLMIVPAIAGALS